MSDGWRIEELLPHAAPMLLLDRVIDHGADHITTSVTIHAGSRFARPALGVPAHVGIEYMAQTCGALAGLRARAAGQPVRFGYLLGTRRYWAATPWFPPASVLRVTAVVVFAEPPMWVFDCSIHTKADHAGEPLARASLTVYQPIDDRSANEI